MTKSGHVITGGLTSLAAYGYADSLGGLPWLAFLFCHIGANAPDWMEVTWMSDGKRKSLFPHRGPTHWFFGWGCLMVLGSMFSPTVWGSCLIGFSMSSITHLLMDLPNPLGVPLFSPFKRTSLNLWTSGRMEMPLALLWFLLCFTLYWMFTHYPVVL